MEELCVFVKLPLSAGIEELQTAFNGIAKLKQVEIPRDKKNPGQHRGMAFVFLKDEASVSKALNACISIGDQRLDIQKSKIKSHHKPIQNTQATRKSKSKIDPGRIVMLRNIPHKATHKVIINAMGEFGDLTNLYLPLRRNGKDNIGVARIMYNEEKSATRALEEGKITIDDQEVQIWRKTPVKPLSKETSNVAEEEGGSYYPSDDEQNDGALTDGNKPDSQENTAKKSTNNKPRGMPSNEVFVGNLKFEWTESDVRGYFKRFGDINGIQFPFNKVFNINKGYAVITFNNEGTAVKVLKQEEHYIRKWKVEVVGRKDYEVQEEKEAIDKIRATVTKRRERRKRKYEENKINEQEAKRRKIAATGTGDVEEDEVVVDGSEEALAAELFEWNSSKEKKKNTNKNKS